MEMVEFAGMSAARQSWDAERAQMQEKLEQSSTRIRESVDAIIAERGQIARDIVVQRGQLGLFKAYRTDPTLGVKTQRRG